MIEKIPHKSDLSIYIIEESKSCGLNPLKVAREYVEKIRKQKKVLILLK